MRSFRHLSSYSHWLRSNIFGHPTDSSRTLANSSARKVYPRPHFHREHAARRIHRVNWQTHRLELRQDGPHQPTLNLVREQLNREHCDASATEHRPVHGVGIGGAQPAADIQLPRPSDERWSKIESCLPTGARGKPRVIGCRVIGGVRHVSRSGFHWQPTLDVMRAATTLPEANNSKPTAITGLLSARWDMRQ